MDKITFSKLERTCSACPTQWEGYTKNGYGVYIRFRHGHFYVAMSKEPVDVLNDDFSWFVTIKEEGLGYPLELMLGDEWAGYMTDLELRRILKEHNFLEKESFFVDFCWYLNYYKNWIYERTIGRIDQYIWVKYGLPKLLKECEDAKRTREY